MEFVEHEPTYALLDNAEPPKRVQGPMQRAYLNPKRSIADDLRHMWHIEAGDLNDKEVNPNP